MPEHRAQAEMTIEDWRLIHGFRAAWALRRRKLSKPMRARIDGDIERLLAALEERRIDPALRKVWRSYPARGRDLSFSTTVELAESGMSGGLEPPLSDADLKRSRRSEAPPAATAGELLERVERAVKDAMR
jgi:hypothetical protein